MKEHDDAYYRPRAMMITLTAITVLLIISLLSLLFF
jgi:hypothetical protein